MSRTNNLRIPSDFKYPIHASTERLCIIQQESMVEEKFAKNGVQKIVHVVVKNTPFLIQVGIEDSKPVPTFDFNTISLEAILMYDCDDEKFVDFVKHKPLEYKGHISEKGDRMTIEVRIKVLTSQLEDMFFKLRIKAVDHNKEEIPNLVVTTQPIKVVSKQEQISRIKNKQLPTPSSSRASSPTRKRSQNQLVSEALQRIESQQNEQNMLLKKLLEKEDNNLPSAAALPSLQNNKISLMGGDSLEDAFRHFMSVFKSTDPNDRPKKVRKLVRESSTKDSEVILEFMDLTRYEMQKDSGTPFPQNNLLVNAPIVPQPPQTPATEVYSKADLERIDEFYREFLSLPEMM